MKRILFLGGPVFQIPIIQKAKEMGLYVGVIDINLDAPAFAYADEHYSCSILEKKEVLKYAHTFHPDGVICGACDTSVQTSAYVCEKLGLVGHTEATALKATNKLEMIQAFAECGVPHPFFQIIRKEDLYNFRLDLPYPIISKPTDSAGSRGVCKIESPESLQAAVIESSKAGESGDVLIEEYMEGLEVSVEVLVIGNEPHVLQITDKLTSGAPHFYEIGHSQPSSLSEDTKQQIVSIAKEAARAVGLVNTPAHIEMRITSSGPKLIELGGRMGGDCITTYLINNSIDGINMSEMAIRLALGESPTIPEYRNRDHAVAVRFIPSCKGVVKEIRYADEATMVKDVLRVEIWAKVGEVYEEASSNSQRFGFVIAKGKTKEEALATCQKAIDYIQIIME